MVSDADDPAWWEGQLQGKAHEGGAEGGAARSGVFPCVYTARALPSSAGAGGQEGEGPPAAVPCRVLAPFEASPTARHLTLMIVNSRSRSRSWSCTPPGGRIAPGGPQIALY